LLGSNRPRPNNDLNGDPALPTTTTFDDDSPLFEAVGSAPTNE
jgi:hypothetical protein